MGSRSFRAAPVFCFRRFKLSEILKFLQEWTGSIAAVGAVISVVVAAIPFVMKMLAREKTHHVKLKVGERTFEFEVREENYNKEGLKSALNQEIEKIEEL